MFRSRLLTGTALLLTASSFVSAPGFAQNTPAASDIETITVTGSRIQVQGYQAPTPVTVLPLEALERDARPDIGDVLRQLPSFGSSTGPNNSVRSAFISDGSAGLNLVSLRNLGSRRTLVLFNGQRVVESNLAVGGVDLSTIPSSLVSRIDVVTGGASAAWGSNAVAGVVNVIIDTELEGLRTNFQAGNTWNLDRQQYEVEASYGTGFANDRAHVIVSANASYSPETFFINQIKNNRYTRYLDNPAYTATNNQPRFIHVDYAGPVSATPGGIITGGPLRGTYFEGPSATPLQFNYGISNSTFTAGGTPNFGLSQSDFGAIANPYDSVTLFGYSSYEVTDNIKASVQLNYGRFHTLGNGWTAVHNGSLTISRDNPFIPESIVQRMDQLGITSFPFGTTLTGDMRGNGGAISAQTNSVSMSVLDLTRQLYRGIASLDGTVALFDNMWTWNAYYQHGEARSYSNSLNNPQTQNIRNAVDAVRVTEANVGTSGLPIGSIACRSTLTNPSNGCVPLDVFGYGKDLSAAAAYVNTEARAGRNDMRDALKMDVAAVSASGELPFGLPAGNISAAAGAEYRSEKGQIWASASGIANLFYVGGNFKPFYGKFNTKEAFLEFNVPLIQDGIVQSLDFDVAGRYTDYSFSGVVGTYKVGALSQINDLLRLRGTFSHDIRAPGLFELFNKGQTIGNTVTDPRTGNPASVFQVTQGNINLKPEIGNTLTFGVIVTPVDFVPGLRLSVDWWRIEMKDVINTVNSNTTINQCIAGVQAYCNNLIYEGPNGALSRVLLQPVNAAAQLTTGFDFSADYTTPILSGDLNVGFLGTYVYDDILDNLGVRFDAVGGLGGNARRTSIPKFKGTLSGTYSEDTWSITTQVRIIGSAVLNKEWTAKDIDNNIVPSIAYLDLRGSVDVSDGIQLYGAMDNVLDRSPPIVTSTTSNSYYAPFLDTLHDVFGRVMRVGVRLRR